MESASTALFGADDSCDCFADRPAELDRRACQQGGHAMIVIANALLFDSEKRDGPALAGEAISGRALGLHADAQGSWG